MTKEFTSPVEVHTAFTICRKAIEVKEREEGEERWERRGGREEVGEKRTKAGRVMEKGGREEGKGGKEKEERGEEEREREREEEERGEG